ncbi:MAG: hydroxylamine reductase [Bacillota bacterium]|nr:hydroxylamine reductase [Bacillota bacterium]
MTMFCFQCEETNKGAGCLNGGACGKTIATAELQDKIIVALSRLAAANGVTNRKIEDLFTDALFMTLTNVNFDDNALQDTLNKITSLLNQGENIDGDMLWQGDEDIRSLRSTYLFGVKGVAAYYHHAKNLGYYDNEISQKLIAAMAELEKEHTVEEWLGLLMDCGKLNYNVMALLDRANTETYGHPTPTEVPFSVEPGPFIVVTGHDLKDLKDLLDQTEGKGVNIYTHSDMLPAHGYPELKKYPHFKGNFGTAWCNQRLEFDDIPAPILYTTNCIQRPKDSYLDRIFTTAVVGYPNTTHIEVGPDGVKDFGPLITKALALGGYKTKREMTGMNGGKTVTTGFGHKTILDAAGQIVEAVKNGDISHFFLVGGCDGHRATRDYYTKFVKATPQDSIVLTLACGKFRFNDLEIGNIGPFPRILDMGQCNDAYGAIQVALALAEAFNCDVNQLPLTLVLSWYEQKAISIVLTLLALGVKNIYVGPTIPAFFSPTVVNVLVEKFGITPITEPEADLAKMLK